MTTLDNLLYGPGGSDGLLSEIRTALVAETGLTLEMISLTFDGNKLVSLNYNPDSTQEFPLSNLGKVGACLSDVTVSIAKRVPTSKGATPAEAVRVVAVSEVLNYARIASDTIVDFRRGYVSKRNKLVQVLDVIGFSPTIEIDHDWGRNANGGQFLYRFAQLSFQLPHCL